MKVDILLALTNYTIGSIMFAIHVPRLLRMQDPRDYGSKNPGSTNAFRQSTSLGFWVFLGDVLKGLIAGKIALHGSTPLAQSMIGISCFIGHLFPIFHRFQGGKGIATGLGLWIIMCPTIAVIGLTFWFIVLFVFRNAAIAGVSTAFVSSMASINQHDPYSLMVLMMLFLTSMKHIPSLVRAIEFK